MTKIKVYIAILLFFVCAYLYAFRFAFARIAALETVTSSQQALIRTQNNLIKKLVQSNNDMGAAVNKLESEIVRYSDFPKVDPRDVVPTGGAVITIPLRGR